MKRTVGILVAVAALGSMIYLASRLWAQAPYNAAAAARPGAAKTRVALLNLKYVVTNYKKWVNFQSEYKSEYDKYENQVKDLSKQMEGYKTQLQNPQLQAADKDRIEKDAKNLQRRMQDIADEAKNTLGKKEADMLVIIYKEVAASVSQFAVANDIDLVMHYNDATSDVEMNSVGNITRKMGSGPCIPLYYKPNEVDISAAILQYLNNKFTAQAPPAAGAPTAHN